MNPCVRRWGPEAVVLVVGDGGGWWHGGDFTPALGLVYILFLWTVLPIRLTHLHLSCGRTTFEFDLDLDTEQANFPWTYKPIGFIVVCLGSLVDYGTHLCNLAKRLSDSFWRLIVEIKLQICKHLFSFDRFRHRGFLGSRSHLNVCLRHRFQELQLNGLPSTAAKYLLISLCQEGLGPNDGTYQEV